MKVRMNPKGLMLLAAAALVGGAAGSYFQWSSLQEQIDKAATLRTQMRDETETRAQLEESTKKLNATVEQLSHLEKGVPQLAYVATLLKELDRIGTDNGIQVLGVRPIVQNVPLTAQKSGDGETAKARKPYQELNIEVKGRGDYRSVMNFVSSLKQFPKIVAARTISLTPKIDGSGKDSRLDVVIELRAFLFPSPQMSPTQLPSNVEAKREEAPRNNG